MQALKISLYLGTVKYIKVPIQEKTIFGSQTANIAGILPDSAMPFDIMKNKI